MTTVASTTSSGAQQQPTFRAAIELVAVDVQVVDRNGRPITGLGPDQFEVSIDGRRRRVASVDLIQHSQSATVAADGAQSDSILARSGSSQSTPGRVFMLAVDLGSFGVGDARDVMTAARGFLNQLLPTDLVGLYAFPVGPRVEPTEDRAIIGRRLDTLVGTYQSLNSQYHLSAGEIIDITAESAASAASAMSAPARGQTTTNTGTALFGNEPTTIRRVQLRECGNTSDLRCVEAIQTEASALAFILEGQITEAMSGLGTLLRNIGNYPGRKTVVILSAGMPASDRPGGRPDMGEIAKSIGRDAAQANASIYALFIDTGFLRTYSPETRRNDKMQVSGERDSALKGRLLDELAGSSGGTVLRVLVGSGEGAFERVLRETSSHYLLGVEPADADRDGKLRQLKVKVNRPGVEVRSRMWVIVPRKR